MSEGEEVLLYVYDLSGGIAARLSPSLIGKQIEGIWHTGVVTFGKEYYFGSQGISVAEPGSVLHEPLKKISLGKTFVPLQVFEEYLSGLAESEFRGDQYNLLKHNCNNFSDTISNFLVGSGIPEYILNLPDEILSSSFNNPLIGAVIGQITGSPILPQPLTTSRERSPDYYQIHSEIEAARHYSLILKEKRNKLYEKLARRERKKNKRKKEVERNTFGELKNEKMADEEIQLDGGEPTPQPSEVIAEANRRLQASIEEEERKEREEREERRRNREPPVVFKDAVDVHIEFDSLVGLIDGKLNEEEQQSLEELHKYMLEDEGSWALGEQFLSFVGRILTDKSLGEEAPIRILQVLAAAALKDDVILMLHQDRKLHCLMNYAYDVDRHPLGQQRALTLFICNLFENIGSSEWLMYISEWTYNNNQLSNIRVTTKVAVNGLLSDDAEMQDRGSAIMFNLATKEVKTVVFDDIAVELTMAVLQYLSGENRPEGLVFRCLKSLHQFCQVSGQDVPQLIQMIGPHPSTFKGQSERNDQLIEDISKRIR